MLVGIPILSMMALGWIPGLQLLILLPWMWLVTPPALVLGRPLFNWTEVGYQPQSGWAVVSMLGFWLLASLLFAMITAWLRRNTPEPAASKPIPEGAPEPRHYAPPVEVLVCPACRATNSPAKACFRCGAPLPTR